MTHNTLPSCCVYTEKAAQDAVITARKQEVEEEEDDDGVSPKKLSCLYTHPCRQRVSHVNEEFSGREKVVYRSWNTKK